jgi:hypothetical protein
MRREEGLSKDIAIKSGSRRERSFSAKRERRGRGGGRWMV